MTAPIDLSKLPAPNLVETLDFETIVSAMTADLTARMAAIGVDITPVLALESEPLVKLIDVAAYRELTVRASFNQRARAALLAYAVGPDLDNVVVNLGVQRETGELDDALRARALLAPDSWSTCGPYGAYKFYAKSADPSIVDVAVSSPTPGAVRIAVLTNAAGGVASAGIIAAVVAAVTPDTVRPLTDNVTVVSAATASYDVTAELLIGPGPDSATVVAAATAAVQAYATAQAKLGLKIARNALIAALMQPGVDDLVLTAPAADVAVVAEVAPVLGALTLTTGAG